MLSLNDNYFLEGCVYFTSKQVRVKSSFRPPVYMHKKIGLLPDLLSNEIS